MHILFFILILVLLFIFLILRTFGKVISFFLGGSGGRAASQQPGGAYNSRQNGTPASEEVDKVFPKEEGEYVSYEEIE